METDDIADWSDFGIVETLDMGDWSDYEVTGVPASPRLRVGKQREVFNYLYFSGLITILVCSGVVAFAAPEHLATCMGGAMVYLFAAYVASLYLRARSQQDLTCVIVLAGEIHHEMGGAPYRSKQYQWVIEDAVLIEEVERAKLYHVAVRDSKDRVLHFRAGDFDFGDLRQCARDEQVLYKGAKCVAKVARVDLITEGGMRYHVITPTYVRRVTAAGGGERWFRLESGNNLIWNTIEKGDFIAALAKHPLEEQYLYAMALPPNSLLFQNATKQGWVAKKGRKWRVTPAGWSLFAPVLVHWAGHGGFQVNFFPRYILRSGVKQAVDNARRFLRGKGAGKTLAERVELLGYALDAHPEDAIIITLIYAESQVKEMRDAERQEYYQEYFGFDVVTDRIPLDDVRGAYRYRSPAYPLEHDPALTAAGVTIQACTTVTPGGTRNRIIFRKITGEGRVTCGDVHAPTDLPCREHDIIYMHILPDGRGTARGGVLRLECRLCKLFSQTPEHRVASVDCVHTAVGEMPAGEALALSDHPAKAVEYARSTESRPVKLSPEDHFAALKSYVAGIAEMGVGAMLRAGYATGELGGAMPFGFNSLMQSQVLAALRQVAPLATQSLLRDLLLDLVEAGGVEWVLARYEVLDERYNIRTCLREDPALGEALWDAVKGEPISRDQLVPGIVFTTWCFPALANRLAGETAENLTTIIARAGPRPPLAQVRSCLDLFADEKYFQGTVR